MHGGNVRDEEEDDDEADPEDGDPDPPPDLPAYREKEEDGEFPSEFAEMQNEPNANP